jgi:pectate lyase
MRRLTSTSLASTLVAGLALIAPGGAMADDQTRDPADTLVRPGDVPPLGLLIGRQQLRADDGWGSAGPGTSGGADAEATQVHIARSRADLIAALGGDNGSNRQNDTSKIIFLEGEIDGFEDPKGGLLTCDDFADPEYDFDAYLATYDPDVWGRDEDPSEPLEDARVRSMRNQERQVQLNVGSNTTLIGLPGATLRRLTLMFDSVDNVIVRNITFEEAADCQPRWRPTDGEFGNWNSQFDNVSIRRAENFWVDNNTFRDSGADLPEYFGRKWEVYDANLDITHTSNWVTVSNNIFRDHDKLMLIGSTNNPGGGDPGRLNVTLRNNVFDGVGQRAPRIRFGQVDVYNNYYKVAVSAESFEFDYLWGIGVESQGYFENNYVDLRGSGVDPAEIIRDWGGTALTEIGTWVRAEGDPNIGRPSSLLDAYNAVNDPQLGDDAGWVPELRRDPVLPAVAVPAIVGSLAGAGPLTHLLL